MTTNNALTGVVMGLVAFTSNMTFAREATNALCAIALMTTPSEAVTAPYLLVGRVTKGSARV